MSARSLEGHVIIEDVHCWRYSALSSAGTGRYWLRACQLIRILMLAGHPEFTPDIVTKVIGVREEMGVFSQELAAASRRAAVEHDAGVYIGRVLLGILGV